MGRVERADSLDELLSRVPDAASSSFYVLLEDWAEGLSMKEKMTAEQLKKAVGSLREAYGDNFAFRAFNASVDLHWNGELGINACCDDGIEEKEVKLPLLSLLPKMREQYPAAERLTGGNAVIGGKPKDEGVHGDYVRYIRLESSGSGREG